MSNLSITAGSAPSQSTPIRKGATIASCAIAILSLMVFAASASAAPLLWNQLGSNAQVTNSAYGPNLGFYGGGGW
ncbi:MAG: hypothetical protein QOE14_2802, partial [Humisphaera sp.]|nr:hypothetical protein [Humisphaera sp.]